MNKLFKSITFLFFFFSAFRLFASENKNISTTVLACTSSIDYIADGLTVDFTSTSDGGGADIISYEWSFGDGATSTIENPEHIYLASGIYPVCLTIVTTEPCTNTHCETLNVVNPIDTINCIADFTFEATELSVVFSNISDPDVGSIISYAWDFGDGSYSTDENPEHIYAVSGYFEVCLTITTDAGCSDETCIIINVTGPTGIENINDAFNFTISPNPALYTIQIKSILNAKAETTIYIEDISGHKIKQVFSGELNQGEFIMHENIFDLPDGIYFIYAVSENGSAVRKLIKN